MSNDLEVVVRSSETLGTAPAKAYYQPGQIGVPNTHLMIGRGGSGKMFNASWSYSASFYMTQYTNEKSRAF